MNYLSKSTYTYPAIFQKQDEGGYHIYFPDIEGCFTCGDDIEDGLFMARDVLAFTIFEKYEELDITLPVPTPIKQVEIGKDECVYYIVCNIMEYRRKFSKKAVKKTLTIPEWLNEAALEQKINFSQVLQEALKDRLNLQSK
ncbi:MAG: type II toxin-antitoxin system HicB family antitoxin [Saccharofermentans sp.]|nr:type II toxin-antitoxin system HicB family antitoxin [Saccharofermentans sp.]